MVHGAWIRASAPWHRLVVQAQHLQHTASTAHPKHHLEQVVCFRLCLIVNRDANSKFSIVESSTALEINDRVIAKSATGSRAGILRYIGEPQFASGVWCGIEFEEPVGKNDGTVGGHRWRKNYLRVFDFRYIWSSISDISNVHRITVCLYRKQKLPYRRWHVRVACRTVTRRNLSPQT